MSNTKQSHSHHSSSDSDDAVSEKSSSSSPSRLESIKRKIINAVKATHYMSPDNGKSSSIETLDDNDFSNDLKIVGSKHVQYQYYNNCCKDLRKSQNAQQRSQKQGEIRFS
jgi:hypothetical protein